MIKQNNNIDTISIVGRTELEDVRVYSNDRSDIDKSIVNVGMTGQLISSGNISSLEEITMSADNINVELIWVRKLFLTIGKVLIVGRNRVKMFLDHKMLL